MERILIITIRSKGGGAEKIIDKLVNSKKNKFKWINAEEFKNNSFLLKYIKFIYLIYKNISFFNKIIIGTEGKIGLIVLPFKVFYKRKYILWNHCYFEDYKYFLSNSNRYMYSIVYRFYSLRINASPADKKGIFVANPFIFSNSKLTNNFLDTSNITLLSISSLAKLKNINSTIKSLINLPNNFSLNIYGEGNEKNKLLELSKELNVENRIQFLGFQENPFLLEKENANVLIINSKTEALPTIILESIENGIPVIVSYYVGVEYWNDLKSVLVVEKITSEIITNTVNKFTISNNIEYCNMFENDISLLSNKHSYNNFINILEKI